MRSILATSLFVAFAASPLLAQVTFVVPGTHPTIQAAITAAPSVATIQVLPGTYFETLDFLGKQIVLEGLAGPTQTTIDATNVNTTVVNVSASEPAGTTIRGFRLRGGKGRPFPSSYGFDYYGGAIFVGAANTQLLVENCHLVENALATGTFGGGIYAGGQNVRVTLRGCLIRNNRAWASGGASLCEGQGAVMTFERCTVTGNTATAWAFGHQGGISVANYGAAVVKDCIVWGNAGYQMRAFGAPYNVGTSITGTYSTVQGGYAGSGNLSADPLFVDVANADFTLQPASPCIDAGDPASQLDPDGTRADQGAFAYDQGPAGWVRVQTASAPSARNGQASGYDIGNARTVMFGGLDAGGGALGDTWSWDGANWSQLAPAASPSARWGHSMAYDQRRQRFVMFGGFVPGSGFVDETWEFDGFSWSRVLPTPSPARRGYHELCYDARIGRVVLFGGHDFPGIYYSDVWEWDGVAWSQRATSAGPQGRRGPAVAFDSERNELVVFGGSNATQTFGDTWTLQGATWSLRTPVTSPGARHEADMVFDVSCGRVVMVGGADLTFATNFGDSWAWDGVAWARTEGAAPSPRHGAGVVYDLQRGRLVTLCGRDSAGFLADLWELDGGCVRTMSTVAAPRIGQTSLFRYSYPSTAVGSLAWRFVSPRFVGALPITLPGFVRVGQSRIDIANLLIDSLAVLGSGSSDLVLPIPADAAFVGYQFDVQAVDVDFSTSTVWWAQNDEEVTIAQ